MPVQTPITVDFGVDENEGLRKFVDDNLTSSIQSLSTLHNVDLPKWRRMYKGIPSTKERNWPWPGASNVVVQLIGENVDIVKARIIGTINEVLPLFPVGLIGEWPEEEEAEESRVALEEFMNLMAMEPSELDLLRVESLACSDMVKLGSVVIKSPWETDKEELVVAFNSTQRGLPQSKEIISYDGPRPEKLEYENWGATENAPTIERADFKWHKYSLTKEKIEMRIFDGRFTFKDEEAEDKFLASPDRYGADQPQIVKEGEKDIQPQVGYNHLAEWDIYECWFWKWHNNKKYKIIYTYHKQTMTCLNKIFNFYPENDEPWDLGRLGYTDDGLRGYGFAEMLEYYQECLSTSFNQNADNNTLANTSVVLAGRNPRIDANMGLYPGAVLPLDGNEAAIQQMGRANANFVEDANLIVALAKSRCGVDEGATGGSGSGTVGKKGQYSAMGTFSVMQAGNRRVNVNITDFRYMHLKLGRRFGRNYAAFGIGEERLQRFGQQAPALRKALDAIKSKRMEFPVRAATASINKEIEKQNLMLLTQVQQRTLQAIGMYLQGVMNPAIPEVLKDFSIGAMAAMSQLTSNLYRAFDQTNIPRLQPELETIKKLRSAANGAKQQSVNGQNKGGPAEGNGNASPENVSGANNPEQNGNSGNPIASGIQVPTGV